MKRIKIILHKIKKAKLDRNALINNTVIFILAWLSAYWFFQIFTIIPAFSLGANMLLFNGEIDFNSVNTAASQRDLWSSIDHINTLFLTPVIFSIVLVLGAVLLLIKWNTDRLNIRRYLFWLILCMTVRIGGNFIFGHLFDLWNWNIVTDFMGITYPSMFFKYLCVLIVAGIVMFTFNIMSHEIKLLFNPYLDNRFDSLISNIFLPSVFGLFFLFIWNMPHFPINEVSCILFTFLLVVFFLCRPFLYKYQGMVTNAAKEDYEPINKTPLVFIVLLAVVDVLLMPGYFIKSSPYRYFFVEHAFVAIVILILIIILLYYIRIYNKRRSDYRKAMERKQREIDMLNESLRTSGNENWTQGLKINMDKYQNTFNNNDEEKDDKDDDVVKIDYEHSEQYGFKRYNLKEYNNRYWQ